MKKHILIVDDEQDMLQLLKRSLEPEWECAVETASSGEAALQMIGETAFDMVLADIKMPGMDGLELLELIHRETPQLTVVMMTAYGDIELAVEAMKRGAFDFISKPFEHDTLVIRMEKALERSRLLKENIRLQQECGSRDIFQSLVGKSPPMQKIFETIRMVAKTDLTVLITGESGTGKELTARAIHALSHRDRGPFVAVNCPALPEHILESELFGYKKGAFTDATHNKIGLFQEAHQGTIFLDEIGDISPTIQTKLLRVLQEKEIKPLGATRSIDVDVRIIASTNQNLPQKMEREEFRSDFFYRLNVLPIAMPALSERREDIPLLVGHLLEKHCAKMDKPLKSVSPELMELLVNWTWEGNVRELENILIQGILFSSDAMITPQVVNLISRSAPGPETRHPALTERPYKQAKEASLQEFNAQYIGTFLAQHNGNVTRTAKSCGLERQALQQIMRRYGIKAESFRK